MKTLFLLTPILALLIAAPLNAQSSTVGVRGLALARSSDMPERYVSTKEGYQVIDFNSVQPGELLDAYTEELLPLYEQAIDANNKPVYRIAEQVKLPGAPKSVLILAWKVTSGPRYLAINDNHLDANYNNWLMVNTGSRPIAFQIGEGEKPFVIKPNSIENCSISPPKGKGAAVLGKSVWNDKVKTFYSTYWPIREGERSIVIFVEQDDRIRVRKISDALLKKKNDQS